MTAAKSAQRLQRAKRAQRTSALIEVRRQPTQGRAKQTVDVILETAAELIEEIGLDSFNTNVLAKRAGVRVRSVYRYYPNKLAVVAALWKKMVKEWDVLFAPGLVQLGDPAQDVMAAYESLIRVYIQWLSTRPGAWAVRDTIRAVPELNAQERSSEDWVVSKFTKALEQRRGKTPTKQLKMLCTVIYRASNAILHAEFMNYGRVRKPMLEELKQLIIRYLRPYFD